MQPHHDLPPGLRGVSLHNNKWDCDCSLVHFQSFLVNKSVPYEASSGDSRTLGKLHTASI